MEKINFKKIAKKVIETEINSLKKLKFALKKSFNDAVELIINCKNGKVVISGVGKSGIIGKKISSTLASVGTPSFFVDASSCSHGDLGQIGKNDLLILISFSGESFELKNIIQYVKRNKIPLIGIVSKKNSLLYKASNVKLLIPEVIEADPNGIVPTSSTIVQLAIGDALAIATMKYKKFGKLEFKKFHPSGSLSIKLKTVEDLMITGNKIPFVNENILMKNALKIITRKKLGMVVVKNKKGQTSGIVVDGDIKRITNKKTNIGDIEIKKIMKKNPVSVEKDLLAAEALSIKKAKKIPTLCVHAKNKKKTVGVIHIHNILQASIS